MAKKTTYMIKTPNPHFTGVRNGVQFTNGKGKATRQVASELVRVWGYTCPELETAETASEDTVTKAKAKGKTKAKAKGKTKAGNLETVTDNKRPPKDASNDELHSFMYANKIPYETDDNKADLNRKIDTWIEGKSDENKESGQAESEPEEGK